MFDNDDDKDNDFNYPLPEEIKNVIGNISLEYERIDDECDDYLDAFITLSDIKIHVYVDYRRGGIKTGGTFTVIYMFKNNKIIFKEDYDFIKKNIQCVENIELLCKKFKNKLLFFGTHSNDKIISKLSLCIPKYFYKKIY